MFLISYARPEKLNLYVEKNPALLAVRGFTARCSISTIQTRVFASPARERMRLLAIYCMTVQLCFCLRDWRSRLRRSLSRLCRLLARAFTPTKLAASFASYIFVNTVDFLRVFAPQVILILTHFRSTANKMCMFYRTRAINKDLCV